VSDSMLHEPETPDWKQHAADLEAEMITRGMIFDLIDWSEG
jgi:hypothetical protein